MSASEHRSETMPLTICSAAAFSLYSRHCSVICPHRTQKHRRKTACALQRHGDVILPFHHARALRRILRIRFRMTHSAGQNHRSFRMTGLKGVGAGGRNSGRLDLQADVRLFCRAALLKHALCPKTSQPFTDRSEQGKGMVPEAFPARRHESGYGAQPAATSSAA